MHCTGLEVTGLGLISYAGAKPASPISEPGEAVQPSSSSSESSNDNVHVGAIVGGIIGGCICVMALICCVGE